MFCPKCGNTLNENDKFCESCGAKVEMPTPAVDEVVYAAPQAAPVENNFTAGETEVLTPEMLQGFETAQSMNSTSDLGRSNVADNFSVDVEQTYYADDTQNGGAVVDYSETVQPNVKTKKKMSKKKKAIIGGVLGTIAAAIAVVCIFAWDYVENFFVETFSSDEGYYQYVEGKNVDELASSVGSVVGLFNGDNSNFGNNSTVKVQLGDTVIDYIAQQSGLNKSDIQWLSDLGFATDISMVKNSLSMGMDMLIGDKTALGVDFILDYDNMCVYMCIPQLSDEYVVFEMPEMPDGMSMSDYQQVLETWTNILEALPNEETTTKIIARYLNTAINAIDNVEKDSVTIKANGVSQKCTRLTYTIDEDTVKDILEAVLKEFQNDKDIEKIVKNVVAATGEIDEDDFDDMYEELIDNMDEVIDSIDDIRMGDFEVEVYTYVDGRGEVIGREIEVEDADIDFHYYTTHNGDDVGVELVFSADGQSVELLGSGTLDGDLLDCDYTLSVGGIKMLNVKAVDYDVMKAEEGYTNGKFIITLPKETCELIEDNLDIPAELADMLPEISIEINIKQTESSVSFDIALMKKSDLIVKLSLSSKDTKPSDIVIPSDAFKITDEDDLEEFVSNVDPEKFLQHLKDAGIPESFFDLIEESSSQKNDFIYSEDYYYNSGYESAEPDYDHYYELNEPNYTYDPSTKESNEAVYGGFIY